MAPKGVLFIVVATTRSVEVENSIRDTLVPSARESVKVLTDVDAKNYTTDIRARVTRDLINIISTFAPHPKNRLLVERDVNASIANLFEWWETESFGDPCVQKLSPKAVAREIKLHFKAGHLDWRTHALAEVLKFDGPPVNLEAWLQQFTSLGFPKVGQKIAAQLRVVRTSDLPHHAFAIRSADTFGIQRAHCYVQDDDEGGSWSEMKSLLAHGVEQNTVKAIRWNKDAGTMTFPDGAVDEFVVYEDGLWSGNEAVRRLRTIAATPPSAPVVLRFGIVTDFGLMVVRQAIRSLGLSGKVRVDAAASETIMFLGEGVAEPLKLGVGIEPDRYYQALHDHVRPLAFRIQEDWTDTEKELCQDVGSQLARNWLRERTTQEDLEAKVAQFALGGGRFASTVIFSRSIPKVCLPLLWLDGTVIRDDKSVKWRPLFVDARRVSDASLLHIL